jgi:two-component system nitrate/nitrite response regulator NarL
MTDYLVPADEDAFEVLVTVGNELQRFGIEQMLETLGPQVRTRVNPCVRDSLDTVLNDPGALLIVSSHDVQGAFEGKLRDAIEAGAKILVLFDDKDLENLAELASLRSGGYLCIEELDAPSLADALLRVRGGGVSITGRMAQDLLASVGRSRPVDAGAVRLTPRERQVLRLLVDGLSNKQIARRLEISEHGAKRLVANLLAKMDAPSRTLVVAKALRDGLLDPPAELN